ncbi:hypothetical protein [Plantactinospora sonchi]|uniref:Calcium-binding protein n=1 Tax=Plantactinospora sonchi TaxID=1544735 RepID=A0ABU7RL14_9ACTN
MSDFDVVLERLLSDPMFAAALSAEPDAALAGYRLDADEVALLQLQFGTDPGGQHEVESRTNQSSLFGMFTPLVGFAGAVSVVDDLHASGPGRADPAPPEVPATVPVAGTPVGGLAGLGDEIGRSIESATDAALADPAGGLAGAVTGAAGAETGFGSAGPAPVGSADPASGTCLGAGQPSAVVGFGSAEPPAVAGFGVAEPPAVVGFGVVEPPAVVGSGGAEPTAQAGFGSASPPDMPAPSVDAPAVPEGYRTRVDVDGDGEWDRHSLRGRADGGVDILVDADRDGRTDFVGHDLDADGLVDISEYDRDRDGFFEDRMYDDDGDGWMDRVVRAEPPSDSGS